MGKYEEALERARKGLPIDEVFPELKESEDERIRKKLVEYISDWKEGQMRWNSDKEFCSRALAYLERQKEQKPAEWSEEDEKILESIIARYEFNVKSDFAAFITKDALEDFKKELEWLKSLRPRPHWKPSEEQMDALRIAHEIGVSDNSWAMKKLKTLYNDLKKLIEL